jgi:transcriptional regulator with XRE-family HTH domain
VDDDVRINDFQDFMLGEYAKFAERRKKIRPSMNEFGRWLGVKVTSLDHWMNGNRVPDLANAIILSERLGPRVFDVLGYPPLFRITDPKLRYVILNWEELTDEQRGRIDDVITGAAKIE